MELTLRDETLQRLILTGPFKLTSGNWVVGRYGTPVDEFVVGGTPQEKCDFLNAWWEQHALV